MKRTYWVIPFLSRASKSPFFRIIFSAFAATVVACAPPPSLPQDPPPLNQILTLGPGDVVDVKFRFWPELNDEQTVRPDGKISLQLVDEVTVSGLTPEQLDRHLTQLYESKLKNPEITVVVRSLANQNIYVGGEVLNPGLLPLQGRMTALQAVINSGGFAETGKPESVIVIRKGRDNSPVPIRVDLSKVINGVGEGGDMNLYANDVVYVPKTRIAKANTFVNQYIERLLLFRGVSLGFSYQLRDDDEN